LKLEEKRESLSAKLEQLRIGYLNIINSGVQDKMMIRTSLLKQIEVLVELINTVKMKINLIQQLEVSGNSSHTTTLINPVK
jgi:hypothetical protein